VTALELSAVPIEMAEQVNVIIGQAHFVKTVEDLHEAMSGAGPHLRFGIAFSEASGPCLIRRSGNDSELVGLATRNAEAIAAGHVFVIYLRGGYPINVLNAVKLVPEVVTIFCATSNQVEVIVAQTEFGRAVLGAIDGMPPAGIETAADESARKELLRAIGYKL
jgi:adenosine/AMP kinase